MKTRVAIILPYFGYGGAERMVSRLASHLNLEDVEAEVICIFGEPQNNEMERAISDHGVEIRYIHKGLGFSLGAVRRLSKELNRFSPDVIHTHLSGSVYAFPWVMLHSVRILHTIHSTPTKEFSSKAKKKVMSLLYCKGKAIPVAISDEIKQLVSKAYKKTPPVELVYNPVDVERYACVKKKPHNAITFISVSRLAYPKNHILLTDAFEKVVQKLPDSKLLIVGDGPLRDDIQQHISAKNLDESVVLVGRVDNVEDYLAESDVFVLSSDYEGLPLSVLEAMAAGLPIVSTNVGGVKDVVTNNGILTEPGDVASLADALISLGMNRELREKLSANSIANVKRFDSNTIAAEYVVLYRKYSRRSDQ